MRHPSTAIEFMLTLTMALVFGSDATAQVLYCPKSLLITEQAEPPSDWIADPGQVERPFHRISLFNGPVGEQHKSAPMELAPDDETRRGKIVTQTWRLEAYRDRHILLICRYLNTPVTLVREISEPLTTCEQSFEWVRKTGIVVDPKTPPTMVCR
jgi:hypothetical protein